MVKVGLDVGDAHLALVAASHNGEDVHQKLAAEILADAGLGSSALQNTPTYPLDEDAAAHARVAEVGKTSLAQNCSGKHAGMLATCVAAGWDTDTYLNPEHPLQQAARAEIEAACGPVSVTTVDGCGAPAFGVTLMGLARGFLALVDAPEGSPERRVADAMRAHPYYVAGRGRDAFEAMRAIPGLLAKDGAEGVYAAALPGIGAAAFKVADGSGRPRPAILAAALQRLGVPADQLHWGTVEVLGHGRPVGEVRVCDLS